MSMFSTKFVIKVFNLVNNAPGLYIIILNIITGI